MNCSTLPRNWKSWLAEFARTTNHSAGFSWVSGYQSMPTKSISYADIALSVIASDFFQLPPVPEAPTGPDMKQKEVQFVFETDAWKRSVPHMATLSQQVLFHSNGMAGSLTYWFHPIESFDSEMQVSGIQCALSPQAFGLQETSKYGSSVKLCSLHPVAERVTYWQGFQ